MNIKRYPYISQHWHKSCSDDELRNLDESYIEYWSHRSCGIACALSILRKNGIEENLHTLFSYGIERRAYCDKGWIHSGLAGLIESYEISARAVALSPDNIVAGLEKGNVYIVSVTHQLPVDGKKGGHLILLHANRGRKVFFMDPSTWGENNNQTDINRLFSSYSGRCIEVY